MRFYNPISICTHKECAIMKGTMLVPRAAMQTAIIYLEDAAKTDTRYLLLLDRLKFLEKKTQNKRIQYLLREYFTKGEITGIIRHVYMDVRGRRCKRTGQDIISIDPVFLVETKNDGCQFIHWASIVTHSDYKDLTEFLRFALPEACKGYKP